MKCFWWNQRPNLGDVLTRILLMHKGIGVEWASPGEADFVGIGSVLEWFDGTTATIFGAGRAGTYAPPIDLSHADVFALRGMESRRLVRGADAAILGDPGLLMSDIVKRTHQGYTAVVPHWQDRERMMTLYPGARFVDVTGNPHTALEAIAGASTVVSSSLHGIVLADAFGLPRMWDWFDGVQAQGFKFRDYGSVVGAFGPGEWQQPVVDHIKRDLREALDSALDPHPNLVGKAK